MRKFWWGENSNGNSLMLKCWDSICTPKSGGGLGFRRMKDLNRALIAKLAWSIAVKDDILWVQLVRTKYLRGKSFLHDDISFNSCSWIWIDIIKSRELILKGANFNINPSSNLQIWKDPWIPSITGFKPEISISNPNPLNLKLIKDLILDSNYSWNLDIL